MILASTTDPPKYPNLRAECCRYGITMEHLAVTISVSVSAMRRRVSGKVRLDEAEMRRIRDNFFPFATLDYLFDDKPIIVKPMSSQ